MDVNEKLGQKKIVTGFQSLDVNFSLEFGE